LGVMGFYETSVATQLEFFETSIFEKESLKATKKNMRAHVKQVRQKSGLEPVKEKKARKPRAVKDPEAPKKDKKPRAKKSAVVDTVVVDKEEVKEEAPLQLVEPKAEPLPPAPVTTPVMEETKKKVVKSDKKVVKKAKKVTEVMVDTPVEE